MTSYLFDTDVDSLFDLSLLFSREVDLKDAVFNAGFDIFGATSLVREGNVLLTNLPDWAYYYMNVYI